MNTQKILSKITEKWPAKVLSLAAAIIVSVFYRMNTLENRPVTVPLIVEASESLIPVNSFTDSVRVNLRGEENSINQISEDDIEAYIDLKRYSGEGIYRVPVQVRKKGSALGVEPLEINIVPMDIRINLEQRVRRIIPVYPVLSGKTAQGFELTGQLIIPETVIAEGPRSSINSLNEFITEPVELDGRTGNFIVLSNIINNNPLVTILGNKMIEFHGTISRIIYEPPPEPVEYFYQENESEYPFGDDSQ